MPCGHFCSGGDRGAARGCRRRDLVHRQHRRRSSWLFGPRHGWDLKLKAPAPDYGNEASWAALPSKPGLTAACVPAGVEPPPSGDPPVDVFFIHPTGDMSGAGWNSPLDPNSQTEENTRWMMANQASAFNGCCAVYAPRYREASIFRYFGVKPALFKQSGDFAYGDVDRAFTYFLEHYSKGRPFIIASHSQGTEHGFNLVKRRIDGTPLAQRMVAAYLIGGGITDKDVDALKTVHACASATDLHCVIHWATHGEGATPNNGDVDGKRLCINPLTWERDGGMAPATLNKGAVPMSGRFQIKFWGNDNASGMKFPPLKAPLKAHRRVRNAGAVFCSRRTRAARTSRAAVRARTIMASTTPCSRWTSAKTRGRASYSGRKGYRPMTWNPARPISHSPMSARGPRPSFWPAWRTKRRCASSISAAARAIPPRCWRIAGRMRTWRGWIPRRRCWSRRTSPASPRTGSRRTSRRGGRTRPMT